MYTIDKKSVIVFWRNSIYTGINFIQIEKMSLNDYLVGARVGKASHPGPGVGRNMNTWTRFCPVGAIGT